MQSSVATIYMPYTSFDNLSSSAGRACCLDSRCYIKITTTVSQTQRFFIGDKSSINSCSKEEYNASLDNKENFSIDICCNGINSFQVKELGITYTLNIK